MDVTTVDAARATADGFAYGQPMEYRVLGPVEVIDEGDRLGTGGLKQRTVLAILIANAGVAVSTDRLIEGTWQGDAPEGARHTIQTYVSNLRGVLGDGIVRDGPGYRLEAERSQIDASWFEDEVLATAKIQDDPDAAADRLRSALAVWRGHPYDDVDTDTELHPEITRLEGLRMAALEARIDADLEGGHHAEVLGELDALTTEYPLQERFRAQQMIALFRSGRQAEALRAYQKTRRSLGEELGLDPSQELRELEQRILDQDETLLFDAGRSIVRRAVLVADIDDPDGLAGLQPGQRQRVIDEYGEALATAVDAAGGVVFALRGSATYASFETTTAAVTAAELTQGSMEGLGASGPGLRMAIDVGDVETDGEGQLNGPPVFRSAALVTTAWAGQVLLSADSQAELSRKPEAGLQIKSLGTHPVPGVDEQVVVHQLVISNLPADFPELRTDGTPLALPLSVRGLPGYELRDVVGRGAFGVVHRGYQPSVGREVAIKVIRSDLANEPEFIRRFEVEAQLVARIEHPHIVPLYDYWRDPDGAYLVMRWLRGGSLASRLGAAGRLGMAEAAQLVAQLAPALDVAHRAGVIHRDIKPSNVLFDQDGNAYLTDFGIAFDVASSAAATHEADTGTDVAGLAFLLQRALGDDIPEAVARVLAEATASEPGGRYQTVVAFVGAWEAALGAEDLVPKPAAFTPTRNPYKGLAAFAEGDAGDFYGRDRVIDALLDAVDRNRLVAVVGPSGIGKSSVVHAGLIPALRSGGLPDSESWLITTMVPGHYPFEELASALLRVGDRYPPQLDEELRGDARGMLRGARRVLPEGVQALLVIDQFEELYTLTGDTESRELFLDGLTELITHPHSNARVVVTLRADFFDRPLRHPRFGELLGAATVPVWSPAGEDLGAIVERPAGALGVGFEPGLVERIVGDVAGQPAALPLLEFALTELFAERTTDTLAQATYESGGGVLGALGHRAEDVYEELNDSGQEAARQVMLRLVNLSEASVPTRRRVRRTELDRLDIPSTTVDAVLTAFGTARLLSFDRDAATRGPTVEVAHEALFTQWERFAGWIEAHSEDLILSRRLSSAVVDWEDNDRDPAYLLVAGRLSQFETWAETTDLVLTSTEHNYLAASRTAENARIATRRRRRRTTMAGFAAAAVVAVALAAVAWVQRDAAQQEASLAEARELVGEAEAVLAFDPDLSGLLALGAVDAFGAAGKDPVPGEAVSALRSFIAAQRVVQRMPGGRFVTAHPTGGLLATADGEGVAVWDLASGDVVERYSTNDGIAVKAAFSPDGNLLAVYHRDATPPVTIWDRSTGESVQVGDEQRVGDFPNITFSADGELLAFASEGSGAEVWSVTQRRRLNKFEGMSAEFDGAGRLSLGVCPDAESETCEVRIADPESGTILQTFPVDVTPWFTAWSPDASRLAVADQETAVVLDTANGEEVSRTDVARVYEPTWLPSGHAFLVGGEIVPRLIEAQTGEVLLELVVGSGGSDGVALVPGSDLVASTSLAGETLVIDISELGGYELGGWVAPVETTWHAAYQGESDRIVIADRGSVTSAIDLDGGDLVTLSGAPRSESGWFPLPSRDGTLTPLAEPDGNWVLRRTDTGEIVYRAPEGWSIRAVHPETSKAIVFQENTPGEERTLLVSTTDGSTVAELESGFMGKAAFSPNGELVTTHNLDPAAQPYTTAIFDAETGQFLRSLEDSTYDGVSADFSPDGNRLVIGSLGGDATVFDIAALLSGAPLEEAVLLEIPAHDTLIIIVSVSPDGSMFTTSTRNEPLRLWSLETGQLLGEFGSELPERTRNAGAFHPSLPRLMVASPPNLVRLHTLDVDELVAIAESRLSRNLTEEECLLYLRRPCTD